MKKFILFGAGHFGREAYSLLGDENVYCFCDNAVKSSEEKQMCGKKVIPFGEFMEIYRDYIVVVCLGFNFCLEVCGQLDDAGVEDYIVYDVLKKNVKNAGELAAQFSDSHSIDKLYKKSCRYMGGVCNKQLRYFRRHVDITTLLPATGVLRKWQLKMVEQAEEFFEFIKELDIKPFLVFGNLIGAVRHKGFVPWDDDLDFGFVRSEYEKLLQFAREKCAVFTQCGDSWVDSEGNRIGTDKLIEIYPDRYIFNLCFNCIQVSKFNKLYGKMFFVMDIWVYDFYRDGYGIRQHMEWVAWINEEMDKLADNKEKADFIRAARKGNKMVSEGMTGNLFPGIDNNSGYPGGLDADSCSWIPSDEIFPLKKVRYEDAEFWAPKNIETMLRYQFRDFMEFPEDMGTAHYGLGETE